MYETSQIALHILYLCPFNRSPRRRRSTSQRGETQISEIPCLINKQSMNETMNSLGLRDPSAIGGLLMRESLYSTLSSPVIQSFLVHVRGLLLFFFFFT
ncbi:hypothetical protein EUTSA_v10017472mg [Eutrema salsugineum]|uniref:Uncharacterized protein n=1 Tax=Eutrema salsugineum TaxID=72664 RepID=V4M5U5_EUTSA|nr:hypothetical protein EUTSA_v10017472mg [Eutrema salsugineum]